MIETIIKEGKTEPVICLPHLQVVPLSLSPNLFLFTPNRGVQ